MHQSARLGARLAIRPVPLRPDHSGIDGGHSLPEERDGAPTFRRVRRGLNGPVRNVPGNSVPPRGGERRRQLRTGRMKSTAPSPRAQNAHADVIAQEIAPSQSIRACVCPRERARVR